MKNVRIPDLLAPAEVVETARLLRTYAGEWRTLGDQPDRPATKRRRDALALLVTETRAALLTAVDTHREAWAADVAERVTTTTTDYRTAVDTLDSTRADLTAASSVLGWLDDDALPGLRPYRHDRQPPLDGSCPWDAVLAALRIDCGSDAGPEPTPTPVRPVGRSLAHTTALIPELDVPKVIADTYAEHRALVDNHADLGQQRRQIEEGRRDAESADLREYANAIVAGKGDPGTPAVAALENRLDDIDHARARLATDIADTYATLTRLVTEHRDGWRATVADRHADALDAYRDAVANLVDTRGAYHQALAVAAWLDDTTATELAHWAPRPQPPLAGEPWDVMAKQLRHDVTAWQATTPEQVGAA